MRAGLVSLVFSLEKPLNILPSIDMWQRASRCVCACRGSGANPLIPGGRSDQPQDGVTHKIAGSTVYAVMIPTLIQLI